MNCITLEESLYLSFSYLQNEFRSSHCGTAEVNPPSTHKNAGLIPGLTQWVGNLVLLWLWHRPAAVAPIQPLGTSVCCGCGPKKQKEKKKKKKVAWTLKADIVEDH